VSDNFTFIIAANQEKRSEHGFAFSFLLLISTFQLAVTFGLDIIGRSGIIS